MAGRPRIELGIETLEGLAEIGATIQEAAHVFGIGHATFERRIAETEYAEAWERGQSHMKVSLRRKQIQLALAGNPTMLIWLGKQILGQRDRWEGSIGGPDGGPLRVEVAYVDVDPTRVHNPA